MLADESGDLFTDLDGDGLVDVTAVDTDGDGVLDLAWTDADGDGLVTDDEVHPVTDGGWSTDWYRHEDNFRDGVLPADASAARDDGHARRPRAGLVVLVRAVGQRLLRAGGRGADRGRVAGQQRG